VRYAREVGSGGACLVVWALAVRGERKQAVLMARHRGAVRLSKKGRLNKQRRALLEEMVLGETKRRVRGIGGEGEGDA